MVLIAPLIRKGSGDPASHQSDWRRGPECLESAKVAFRLFNFLIPKSRFHQVIDLPGASRGTGIPGGPVEQVRVEAVFGAGPATPGFGQKFPGLGIRLEAQAENDLRKADSDGQS